MAWTGPQRDTARHGRPPGHRAPHPRGHRGRHGLLGPQPRIRGQRPLRQPEDRRPRAVGGPGRPRVGRGQREPVLDLGGERRLLRRRAHPLAAGERRPAPGLGAQPVRRAAPSLGQHGSRADRPQLRRRRVGRPLPVPRPAHPRPAPADHRPRRADPQPPGGRHGHEHPGELPDGHAPLLQQHRTRPRRRNRRGVPARRHRRVRRDRRLHRGVGARCRLRRREQRPSAVHRRAAARRRWSGAHRDPGGAVSAHCFSSRSSYGRSAYGYFATVSASTCHPPRFGSVATSYRSTNRSWLR